MPFKSKNKRKLYLKAWKKRNRKKQREYNAKWRAKLKEWYINYKNSSPCVICGENRTSVLEAHHVFPKEKCFSLFEGIKSGYSIKKLELEARKCIIVCCLCHRLYHTNSLNEEEQKKWDKEIEIFENLKKRKMGLI